MYIPQHFRREKICQYTAPSKCTGSDTIGRLDERLGGTGKSRKRGAPFDIDLHAYTQLQVDCAEGR